MIQHLIRRFISLQVFIGCLSLGAGAQITLTHLQCHYRDQPMAVDKQPLLSWQIQSSQADAKQTAWQVLVADDPALLQKDIGNLWNSQKVTGASPLQVPYGGKAPAPGTTCYWKVRIWDAQGRSTAWSQPTQWKTGLLNPAGWMGAQWIAYETLADTARVVPGKHHAAGLQPHQLRQRPVTPLFRRAFRTDKPVKTASLYISGLGHYEVYLNGEKPGRQFLAPGWTHYDSSILYNCHDVSRLIRQGENVIGVVVGNGFYHINRERYAKLVIAYGMPKMICRLQIRYTDGSEENIISNSSWSTSPSPITFTSIYGGEDYDANLEQAGWHSPGFRADGWKSVVLPPAPGGRLQAEADYPLEVKQQFAPRSITKLKDSTYLYDFGQNCSGIISLKIKGRKGQQVKLIPAELRDKNGYANQSATGSPYYYTYTCRGDGEETWRPAFTYYGMRYVQVEAALPDSAQSAADLPHITALQLLHVRNSAPKTGSFACSNPLLNQIFMLINWGIRSNLVSVVSDCPHREKLGWLEQTFLMGNGIQYNFHIANLYQKIVQDMMEAQLPNGLVPDIAPEYVAFDGGFRDSPEWGSAAIILPWLLYQWYADTVTMRMAWPMMERYGHYLKAQSNNHILSHGLGDWFDLGPGSPGEAQLTPKSLTASAIYCYDLQLMAQMAALMQRRDASDYYRQMAAAARERFNQQFFDPVKAVYSTGSQTAMAMPLCLNLVPDEHRNRVMANLADSIKAGGYALTAGDVGFHFLVQALTEGGYHDLLYQMINRDDVPGYGYQLKMGATALTESWQALPNVSNNHLMLGHVMEWFYAGVGGIHQAPGSAGWSHVLISPQLVGDLQWANTSFQSPRGEISTLWSKTKQQVNLAVHIPANARATLVVPKGASNLVIDGKPNPVSPQVPLSPGHHDIHWAPGE